MPLPPYKRVVEPAASPSDVEKLAQQKASAQTAKVKELERKLAATAKEKATREARAAAIAENKRQLAEAKRLRLAKAEQDAKDAEMAAKAKAKAEQDAKSAELAAKAKQEQDAKDAELAAKVKREQDAQEAELAAKANQLTPTFDLDACKTTFQNQFSVFVKSNRFKAPDTLSNFFFYIRTPNGSNDCIDCRSGVAKQLGAWLGVRINTLIDPGGNRRYSSGCVGYREDFFGSREGAMCIAKFLGPGYHVDQTCNYQFFPYAIAINP
nr:hypothetical protein [Rhodoferax sp.]